MICHQSVLIFIVACIIYYTTANEGCSVEELFDCPEGEGCVQQSLNSSVGVCVCLPDYIRLTADSPCVPHLPAPLSPNSFTTNASGAAILVGLLVPLFALLIIVGLVLAARRYRWVPRVREHAHQLQTQLSSVNYDTVLVGRDSS